ncbi:gamma-glutamylcyclotransferase family protein [Oceanicoccus sagamiensis]|uniref:Gamma-glutamylcyclotransferase family protein n=1 Tax=Oceanicoccus sagamiensis TaxID=716816 RepID=A0A1X9NB51_9GAMM|nr:gamma-glutamylcyclotransferase family protein [Oceanicoccus sagamiensis]ARN74381.1 hypothetical protein BST96_09750 [Oceanicoccus sagamiensis]
MSSVEKENYQVFVYGSLKSGFHNHALLATSCYLGACRTPPRFSMYDLGAFPAVAEGGTTAIYGEVYKVGDDVLALLDQLEGHPEWYCRTVIETEYGDSYIYLIQESMTAYAQVEDGLWVI